MNWVTDLWTNKRWLFWLLLPLVVLYFLKDIIMQLLAGGAVKDVKEAQKKDEEIQKEIVQAKVEGAKEAGKTEVIEKRIEERKAEDVSEDWHKNYKKPE